MRALFKSDIWAEIRMITEEKQTLAEKEQALDRRYRNYQKSLELLRAEYAKFKIF